MTRTVLVHVVASAGHQCQCTGACGSPHAAGNGRCHHGQDGALVALVAAPRDPSVPERQAWRVPTAELSAWCHPCLRAARRLAATGQPDPPAAPALF